MKKLLHLLCFIPFCLFGQSPGGVEAPSLWISPSHGPDGSVELWEKVSNRLINQYSANYSFNFNPTLDIHAEQAGPTISMEDLDISRLQIFTAYRPQDSIVEKVIWSIYDNKKDVLLNTTHRLADFQNHKFMNNLGNKKNQGQINTYQRYMQNGAVDNYTLAIGQKGINQFLPVQNYIGQLGEIIVYNRILNSQEKAKVESYLALKYGTGIDKNFGQSLYNSNYDKLWDIQKMQKFSHALAGIGRDAKSGLYQKQSSSIHSENIFSLALDKFYANNELHKGELSDGQFLIWGEDQAELTLATKQPGQIRQLEKNWQLVNHQIGSKKTQLKFHIAQLPFEIEQDEIFWLIIDRSGKGTFTAEKTQYYAMDEIADEAFCVFSNISWGESKQHRFTIAKGPKLIPKVWVEAPICNTNELGQLHIAAQGGRLPYSFRLTDEQQKTIAIWESHDGKINSISNLEPGNYQLQIEDAGDLKYQEDFFLTAADAPKSTLQDEYHIGSGEILQLDAGLDQTDPFINFEWTHPNGSKSTDPKIQILKPGEYTLLLDRDGCRAEQRIMVRAKAANAFKAIQLFPNPSVGGYFEIDASLEHLGSLEIQIFNNSGQLVQRKKLAERWRHRYQGHLPHSGFYQIRLITENGSETRKLIVHAQP